MKRSMLVWLAAKGQGAGKTATVSQLIRLVKVSLSWAAQNTARYRPSLVLQGGLTFVVLKCSR